jgi:hypothetical protein
MSVSLDRYSVTSYDIAIISCTYTSVKDCAFFHTRCHFPKKLFIYTTYWESDSGAKFFLLSDISSFLHFPDL